MVGLDLDPVGQLALLEELAHFYPEQPFSLGDSSLRYRSFDNDAFRHAAQEEGRSIAQLIREAMAFYRRERLEQKPRLTDLPVLPGPRPRSALPSRDELYDELYSDRLER